MCGSLYQIYTKSSKNRWKTAIWCIICASQRQNKLFEHRKVTAKKGVVCGGKSLISFFFFYFNIFSRSILPGFKKCSLTLLTLSGTDFMDIWRSASGAKNWLKIQCFDQNVIQKLFKSRLVLEYLTDLIENLHKDTTQECKRFYECRFLNFHFFSY